MQEAFTAFKNQSFLEQNRGLRLSILIYKNIVVFRFFKNICVDIYKTQ